MKTWTRGLFWAAMPFALAVYCGAIDPATPSGDTQPAAPISVIVNQDMGFPSLNSIGILQAVGNQLNSQHNVSTEGYGIQGGFFATPRVASIPSLTAPCIYASNSGSNDIASFSSSTQQLVGNFSGSATDDGSENGVGLAVSANYLFAGFSLSNTIGAFALQSGCGLTFLGDVSAVGLQGGSIAGMAANGRLLVVAYGDGSIESFTITNGKPISNGDLQNSTGWKRQLKRGGNIPSGVDITQDGSFAIFGDISAPATVEVSSLATGKLGKTVPYIVGNGLDAGWIRLSPDQTLLYIANSEGGTVTAAFFNKTTGKVTPGCMSPRLRGFNGRPWLGSVVTRDTTGTGTLLYVAEFGRDFTEINQGPASAIGILRITSDGVTCSLAETTTSPVTLFVPGSLSLGVFPPRPF